MLAQVCVPFAHYPDARDGKGLSDFTRTHSPAYRKNRLCTELPIPFQTKFNAGKPVSLLGSAPLGQLELCLVQRLSPAFRCLESS